MQSRLSQRLRRIGLAAALASCAAVSAPAAASASVTPATTCTGWWYLYYGNHYNEIAAAGNGAESNGVIDWHIASVRNGSSCKMTLHTATGNYTAPPHTSDDYFDLFVYTFTIG